VIDLYLICVKACYSSTEKPSDEDDDDDAIWQIMHSMKLNSNKHFSHIELFQASDLRHKKVHITLVTGQCPRAY
jgi:hypothetical protein